MFFNINLNIIVLKKIENFNIFLKDALKKSLPKRSGLLWIFVKETCIGIKDFNVPKGLGGFYKAEKPYKII
jgi:hypothetical protein